MQPKQAVLRAALLSVDRNWPVLPIRVGTKQPLTRHGVKDATLDESLVNRWWDRWPDAGLGIATGAPGPTVLDIDEPKQARDWIDRLRYAGTPEVATARGSHFYFEGGDAATVKLPFGELRGRGAYVLAPPSTHPSGKQYVWLHESQDPLVQVPDLLLPEGVARGIGVGVANIRTLVPTGERHHALVDLLVRLLRVGEYDPGVLTTLLTAYATEHCEQTPPIDRDEVDRLVRWGVRTRIAERERQRAQAVTGRRRLWRLP